MSDTLYLLVQVLIPVGQHIHIVVHKQYVVGGGQWAQTVQCKAHTDVLGRVRIFQSLGLYPLQRAVATIVHMNQNLVRIRRVFADAIHTNLQELQVVPGRNQYREQRFIHINTILLVMQPKLFPSPRGCRARN